MLISALVADTWPFKDSADASLLECHRRGLANSSKPFQLRGHLVVYVMRAVVGEEAPR